MTLTNPASPWSVPDRPIIKDRTDGDLSIDDRDISIEVDGPQNGTWPRLGRALASDHAPLLLFAVALYSYSRGYITSVQTWGEPFFYVDYSAGPIKRGLVGQLFDIVLDRANVGAMNRSIGVVHLLLAMVVIYVITHAPRAITAVGSSARLVLNLGILVFATSQFVPTMAFNAGYFDVYLYAAIVVAALLLSERSLAATGVLIAVAVLIHEGVIFYFIPIIILHLAAARAGGLHQIRGLAGLGLRLCALPFGVAAALYLTHSNEAAEAELALTTAPPDVQSFLVETSFGQSFSSAFTNMLRIWGDHAWSGIASLIYYSIPTVVILALYLRWRRPHWFDGLALICSTFFPLIILLIAWDLSRFVVATQLTAVIAILFWERRLAPTQRPTTDPVVMAGSQKSAAREPAARRPPSWWPAVLVVATILLVVPFTYSYFGQSYVVNGETAPGFMGDALLDLLN